MKSMRSDIAGRGLFVATALAAMVLLGACRSPAVAMNPSGVSDEKIGDICATGLSYDATGPYYASCKNYLRKHSQAQLVAVVDRSQPAEHRACQEIGLARDSPDYRNCVQELDQLDISAAHL